MAKVQLHLPRKRNPEDLRGYRRKAAPRLDNLNRSAQNIAGVDDGLFGMVAATDGTIINEQTVVPDDRIIKAGRSTPFFVQLNVEKSDEAAVTVVPIAKRITR